MSFRLYTFNIVQLCSKFLRLALPRDDKDTQQRSSQEEAVLHYGVIVLDHTTAFQTVIFFFYCEIVIIKFQRIR